MDRLLREGDPPVGQIASPKPQYKKAGSDPVVYESVEGEHGAPYALLLDKVGNKINPATTEGLDAVKGILESADYASETTLTALKTELELIKAEVNALKTIVISSADAKPVGVNGQTLIEHDTKRVFIHDGIDWREW